MDQDADFEVYAGGDRFGDGGQVIGRGTATADDEVLMPFDVDGTVFGEGATHLYVLADNDRGLGHGRTTLWVDNVPSRAFSVAA